MTKMIARVVFHGLVYGVVYALTKDLVTALLAVSTSCLLEMNLILDDTRNTVKEQATFLKKFYDKEIGGKN